MTVTTLATILASKLAANYFTYVKTSSGAGNTKAAALPLSTLRIFHNPPEWHNPRGFQPIRRQLEKCIAAPHVDSAAALMPNEPTFILIGDGAADNSASPQYIFRGDKE